MKEDLMLKKYKTENIYGTYNLYEENTFFNSKIMDIEDYIEIKNDSIKYYQTYYLNINNTPEEVEKTKNNGYQYFNLDIFNEKIFILNITELKLNNHIIYKLKQSDIDEKLNTKWEIVINQKEILKEYLFAKIKKARTFKSVNYKNFLNNNINESIYNYIQYNLLDRYEFDKIELFVQYLDIKNISYNNNILKQYDPVFDYTVEKDDYKVSNINITTESNIQILPKLIIKYNQTKPSTDYKFNFYFNIYYKKI